MSQPTPQLEPLAAELAVIAAEWAETNRHGLFNKAELAELMTPVILGRLRLRFATQELEVHMRNLKAATEQAKPRP